MAIDMLSEEDKAPHDGEPTESLNPKERFEKLQETRRNMGLEPLDPFDYFEDKHVRLMWSEEELNEMMKADESDYERIDDTLLDE